MASGVEKQKKFVEAHERGESIAGIARRFGVSTGTVRYWLDKAHRGEAPRGPGRPPILGVEELAQFRELFGERPHATLREILKELQRRTGMCLREGTARQYLQRMGVRRVRPVVEAAPEGAAAQARATRYQPRHRRKSTRQSYPSDLTDAEWEILRPVFAPQRGPGRPPGYERRRILEAIFYVVRGGMAWRMLPHDFPVWENVYAHFRRWSEGGHFERMHDLLRARWREREGRNPEATASIIDSQSVKTTEKGGPTVTTQARRSTGANDTSS